VLPLHHRAIRLVDGIPQSRTGSLQGAVPDRDKEQNGPSAMDGFVPKTRAPYPPPRQKSTPPTPLSRKRPFILLCPGVGDVNIAVNGDPMAKLPIMHQLRRVAALAQAIVCVAGFRPGASAADSFRTEMTPAAVDAGPYAEFMAGEIQDERGLADMAENQRRWFNRITPAGFSWFQPMLPSAAPFDAAGFSESFLDGLLGEDRNSVAVYPLALTLDPMTRETLVYNSDGHLVAVLPSDGISRAWPEDADPARVVLQLDLLPSEDVEPYLYVEGRIAESAKARVAKPERSEGMVLRSLGANEFGFAGAHRLTNGRMRLTVTNGANVAEIYSYTVWHTSTVIVTTWTNEYDEVITGTNLVWHSTSPPFDGIESAWECQTTNLVLSGGVGTWDDADVPTNARVRFYAAAQRADTDADGLTDGAEIFLHRTDPEDPDTDGDGIPDGAEIDLNLNPVEPSDAMEDPDGDGFSNLLEYQLGSPLDNPAWSGEQLVHRLMHANTNHGLRVEVEDSENCGGTGLAQYVTNSLSVPDLLDCGYFLDITVAGNVEDHMSLYDHVYVRALDEKFYFGGDQNYVACSPVAKTGTLNHLILPNSQITLIYDTVSYKHHVNGYAEITGAAVTDILKVDINADGCLLTNGDCFCIGEYVTLDAAVQPTSLIDTATYSWTVPGTFTLQAGDTLTNRTIHLWWLEPESNVTLSVSASWSGITCPANRDVDICSPHILTFEVAEEQPPGIYDNFPITGDYSLSYGARAWDGTNYNGGIDIRLEVEVPCCCSGQLRYDRIVTSSRTRLYNGANECLSFVEARDLFSPSY
jgi:hypothetical protein